MPNDPNSLFPYDRWSSRLHELAPRYKTAEPFPHITLTGFLDEGTAVNLEKEFPKSDDRSWIQYKHFNEKKSGKSKRAEFPALIGQVIDELNSSRFLAFLTQMTGIPGLLADPMLEGGGMHQSPAGGFLNMHADFTVHHHKPWRRRINLILYLNEGWKEEWNGSLELWDRSMTRRVDKVLPALNNAMIFNTDEHSYHGFPEPIRCPKNVTRKSLAVYYYTLLDDPNYKPRSTNYRARPGDGWKVPFIWLDKQAVHIYSVIKSKLHLSDDFASRILGFLSRKK